MPSCSRGDVILVRYPYTDLTGTKVRPAVVVNAPHASRDLILVPLTSRTQPLFDGEFILSDWAGAGLNVPTAAKRGLYTAHETLLIKRVGALCETDADRLDRSLRRWLGLP